MAAASTDFPHGVEIRVAREEDHQDVMDIDRTIYHGTDYLLYKYMEYVRDPNRICVLLKKDGRTIAFSIFYIVDGGQTVMKQAQRVHADYRGQRYMALIEENFTKFVPRSYDLRQMVWTTTNLEVCEALVKKSHLHTIAVIRPRFSLDFSPMEFHFVMQRPEFLDFQKMSEKYVTLTLTPSGVKEVMLSFPQDVASIIPERFWVVNWEPYQPMASNYDLITKNSTVNVTMADDGGILAISYGTAMDVEVGLRFRADYYVRPGQLKNEELFVSHLMKHLLHIKQSYKGKKHTRIAFSILYSKDIEPMALGIKRDIKCKLDLFRKKTMEDECILMVKQLLRQAFEISKL